MADLAEWYRQCPVVTRTYVTLASLTTAGCALEIITPFNVYFNTKLILQGQIWRLATNFFFFGNLGLDFVFHMFFLLKYCKSLEEGSFRGRSADFMWMLMLGGTLLTAIAPFVHVQFLGSSLTFMMVYVWGRRHQYVNLSFLGIFNFTAPYLPWVLLAFSLMLGSSPVVDLMGMAAGHVYYFLEDVYPRMTGRRPLKTPGFVRALFPTDDHPFVMPPVAPPPPYAPPPMQQGHGEVGGGHGEAGAQGAGAGQEAGDGAGGGAHVHQN